MMTTINFTRLGLAAAMVLGGATVATAFPGGYGTFGYGLGIGGLYRSLDFPTERRVPYFAAHPPVYYSQPVPRTYGYSPFAYGPNVRTPAVAPSPIEIVNPYATSSAKKTDSKASGKRTTKNRDKTISSKSVEPAPEPLVIENPYVVDSPTYH